MWFNISVPSADSITWLSDRFFLISTSFLASLPRCSVDLLSLCACNPVTALTNSTTPIAVMSAVHMLETGWQFKQTDSDEWLPVARVPTNVHLDLIDNKKSVPTNTF